VSALGGFWRALRRSRGRSSRVRDLLVVTVRPVAVGAVARSAA
jgi:hypothetical protein